MKVRKKAAAIAAGTYDPEDTSFWTDKEWDAWNAKQDQAQTYNTGKSAGKYKPNLSKKTAQGIKGAVKATSPIHLDTNNNNCWKFIYKKDTFN